VPIPGTKRRKWLEQNVAAAAITLSPAALAALGAALAPGKVQGPRYSPERMAMVDR
jgi:aryl-alcohol dehydrogenase-like predicted oxidoreductase